MSVFDDYPDQKDDPDFGEMWFAFADMLRKREKEQALSEPDAPSVSGSESDAVEGHAKPKEDQ